MFTKRTVARVATVIVIACCGAWLSATSIASVGITVQLYVDPVSGSDSWPGSFAQPFKSIEKARDTIRQANYGTDVFVNIKTGNSGTPKEIVLTNTLEFTTLDNIPGKRVTYRRYPSTTDQVVITGSTNLSGGWTPSTFGPGVTKWTKSLASSTPVRELWIDNVRMQRARYPDAGSAMIVKQKSVQPLGLYPLNYFTQITFEGCHPIDTFLAPTCPYGGTHTPASYEMELIVKSKWSWFNWHQIVQGASRNCGTDPHTSYTFHSWMTPIGGANESPTDGLVPQCLIDDIVTKGLNNADHAWLENHEAFMNVAYEWYWKPVYNQSCALAGSQVEILLPSSIADLNTHAVRTGGLQTLMRIVGSNDKTTNRVALTFEEIHFGFTSYAPDAYDVNSNPPKPRRWYNPNQAGNHVVDKVPMAPAAIELQGANDVTITNCRVAHTAGSGISLFGDNCLIQACEIYDVGAHGIFVAYNKTGSVNQGQPPSGVHWLTNNTILYNYIHDFGVKYLDSVAVFGARCDDLVIQQNEIANGPHTGVALGYIWSRPPALVSGNYSNRNMTVSQNLIHHVMRDLWDGAAVYCLGAQPAGTPATGYTGFSTITGNWTYSVGNTQGINPISAGGLYFDEGSCYWRVRKNILGHDIIMPILFNTLRCPDLTQGDEGPWHHWDCVDGTPTPCQGNGCYSSCPDCPTYNFGNQCMCPSASSQSQCGLGWPSYPVTWQARPDSECTVEYVGMDWADSVADVNWMLSFPWFPVWGPNGNQVCIGSLGLPNYLVPGQYPAWYYHTNVPTGPPNNGSNPVPPAQSSFLPFSMSNPDPAVQGIMAGAGFPTGFTNYYNAPWPGDPLAPYLP